MADIKYRIATEIAYVKFTALLDAHEIPYKSVLTSSSTAVFPSLDQDVAYAEVFVSQVYHNQVLAFLSDFKERDAIKGSKVGVDSIDKVTIRRKIPWVPILTFYAIIATVFAIRSHIILNRNSWDKNYIYEWSYDARSLYVMRKATDKSAQVWTDHNLDFNYEESRSFARNGELLTLSRDENENGVFEEMELFSKSGELVSRYLDINEDGFIEEQELYSPTGQPTSKGTDSDNNGRNERLEFYFENNDTLVLVDSDQDGFFVVGK